MYYRLEGHNPVPCTLLEWAAIMSDTESRVVKSDYLMDGEIHVSTVFLGLDHGMIGGGTAPVLFETMVFGGPDQERYCTWMKLKKGMQKF